MSNVVLITLHYFQNRDDLEDAELYNHQLTEGMPTTLAGFKDHPLCVDHARYQIHGLRSHVNLI